MGTRPLKANEILLTTHFQANELPGATRSNLLLQFDSEGPASKVAVGNSIAIFIVRTQAPCSAFCETINELIAALVPVGTYQFERI
jgi:hypothetical protein